MRIFANSDRVINTRIKTGGSWALSAKHADEEHSKTSITPRCMRQNGGANSHIHKSVDMSIILRTFRFSARGKIF